MAHEGGWRLGVDTGGTFTDLVAVSSDGEVRLRKVPSTPADPAAACFAALANSGLDIAHDVETFVLGTTIATNAVVQRTGATTIFVTTAGFEDILYIQRLDRPGLYDLQWVKSEPLAVRHNTIGVHERILADGSIRSPLTGAELQRLSDEVEARLGKSPGAAVAISLLFAYVNDAHEKQVAARLRERLPGVPISVSSEVAPIWREYERSSTTVIDAYVKPIVLEFAQSLDQGLALRNMGGWRGLMKSNGGQIPIGRAADRPVEMVVSGLAGGMIAGNHWARVIGSNKAVSLDMGGTSADVGVIVDGRLKFTALFEVSWGVPAAVPIVDVTTIGAGGSSIAAIDHGGLLTVGPASAGADPGPASYGRGGVLPTVTDANLAMGRLDPNYFLGGKLRLEPELATRALRRLCDPLELDVPEVADAIVSVSIENMAGAIRLVTVDRGYDYRDFDLVAFGGAGPLHAAEIARRMGMRRVVVPPSPGLASAFGAVIADERVDRRTTVVRRLDRTDAGDVAIELAALAESVRRELVEQRRDEGADVLLTTTVGCRYLGQNYEQEIRMYHGHVDRSSELAIPIAPDAPDFVARLASGFHEVHLRSYGYNLPDQPIQSVYLGATALTTSRPVSVRPYSGSPVPSVRRRRILVSAGNWEDATVLYRHELAPGYAVSGAAIIEEPDSTTFVPAGLTATVDPSYCLVLTVDGEARS